jgi:hypothetical protein
MTGIGVSSIFSCFMILVGGLRCSMILVTINVSAILRYGHYVSVYDFVISVHDFVYVTLL